MFEHDAEEAWWAGVVAATRAALADLPSDTRVEAIGLSACGPCLVPVDGAGRALRPGILYGVDTRASAQVAATERAIGPDKVRADFGMPLSSQTVGPKIDWLVENEPETFAATSQLLTANSFVAYRLSGRACIDHHQAAYFAPYYRDGAWDSTYDTAGVVSRLPELAWSDEVIGAVTDAAAAQTGLPPGVPVVLGSSDGLTGAYGAGTQAEGDGVLNYGTTLGLTVFAPRTAATGGVWRTPGAVAGQDCLLAGLSTGGVLATWFVEQLGRDLLVDAPDDAAGAYHRLAEEAERSPAGAAGLLLLPYFAGERTPIYDPGAAGVLLGLRLSHSRGDLYRAVLEGTAYGIRHVLEEMSRLGGVVETLRAVGGGLRTALWQQIVSDVTGLPQKIISPHHGAPVGAAHLAALGTGLVAEGHSPSSWVAVSKVVTPQPAVRPVYDARFAVYLEAYQRTRPLIEQLRPDDAHESFRSTAGLLAASQPEKRS